jgi:MSHA pilin protein MshC
MMKPATGLHGLARHLASVEKRAPSPDARAAPRPPPCCARGFSLVELIVILLLIGILSVAALARMDSMRVFGERSDYDMVRSAIQHARKAAIAKRRYVCVQASASALTLTVDTNPPESTSPPFAGACPFAAALPLPQPDTRDPPCPASNVLCLRSTSLSFSNPALQFDALGRAAATATVTVSGYAPITVEAETGLVY